jgi:hypothetical protein
VRNAQTAASVQRLLVARTSMWPVGAHRREAVQIEPRDSGWREHEGTSQWVQLAALPRLQAALECVVALRKAWRALRCRSPACTLYSAKDRAYPRAVSIDVRSEAERGQCASGRGDRGVERCQALGPNPAKASNHAYTGTYRISQ